MRRVRQFCVSDCGAGKCWRSSAAFHAGGQLSAVTQGSTVAEVQNCWLRKRHARVPFGRQAVTFSSVNYAGNRKRGARMALSLPDVWCDPIANRALNELMHHYTVAQEKSRLVLTKKTGEMKLFLNDLDDLHQWDFMRNQQMVKEIERLRGLLATTNQHRESWKVRALMAEAQLLEATAKTGNKGGGAENVGDVRYASLKRYLAKRFHPDYAPGLGIEKIVRSEIFKEIWNEIDRLDQGVSAARGATARSAAAA